MAFSHPVSATNSHVELSEANGHRVNFELMIYLGKDLLDPQGMDAAKLQEQTWACKVSLSLYPLSSLVSQAMW